MRRAFALLVLMSCSATIDAANYDQTCTTAADCAAVFTGSVCEVCGGCANSGINTAESSRYANDREALRGRCPPKLGTASCGACPTAVATCIAGKCGSADAP